MGTGLSAGHLLACPYGVVSCLSNLPNGAREELQSSIVTLPADLSYGFDTSFLISIFCQY